MFSTLIASGHGNRVRPQGALPSVLFHAAVVTAMVVATAAPEMVYNAPSATRVIPLSPPSRPVAPAAPAAPRVRPVAPTPPVDVPAMPTVPVDVPMIPVDVPSGVVPSVAVAPSDPGALVDPNALPGVATNPNAGLTSGDAPLDAESVDVPAALRSQSPLPLYPEVLRQSRVAGVLRVRFIVGTDGRAELSTLQVLDATHPAFAESVRRVLPRLRFNPARVGRRAVRQVVEIPFGFELR
jgi:protein TonB